MTDMPGILGRGAFHSLTGLCVQALVAGLLVCLSRVYPQSMAGHVVWSAFAGVLVWLHLLVTYTLLTREAKYQFLVDTQEAVVDGGTGAGGRLNRIHLFHRGYQRFLVPVIELGVAALLIQGMRSGWGAIASPAASPPEADLLLIALYSVVTLVLIMFAVYVTALMRTSTWHLLTGGRNISVLMLVMFSALLIAACGWHFGFPGVAIFFGWGLTALNGLLASEVVIFMALGLFAPRRPDTLRRPAFVFYLLEGLSQPLRIGKTVSSMLEGVFGFDVASTSLARMARSLLVPSVFLTILLLLGLSSVIIVKPYEQAIVLNLGRLEAQPLDSGLHFSLPWPLAEVRHFNVSRLRSIHVGSHKPDRTGGTVYREGFPILWTNIHGLNVDEPLICSSPRDRTNTALQGGDSGGDARRVPSVSLAAADVHVQYLIKELSAYVRASAMPEAFLQKVAEAFSSRYIYRYDIDALFCEARLVLAEKIRCSVQAACNMHNLGIKIVHVAITGVHPPVEVAGAFEETVAALQERETEIQYACQQAIRTQVEATGSTEAFDRLLVLADSADAGRGIHADEHDRLLHDCGGEVSEILARAESYRFSRENAERGKTERFGGKLDAHAAAPLSYRYDRYLSVLEKGLSGNRKVVLLGNPDNTFVRLGLEPDGGMGELPQAMDF